MLLSARLSSLARFSASFVLCLLLRFVPFRPPNVEPVLAFALPVGSFYGPLASGVFAAFSIVAYDALTAGLGSWTLVAAASYGLVGIAAGHFGRTKRALWSQLLFALAATMFYDVLTGVVASALLFDMPWYQALVGQVPFTINHVIGTLVLTAAISPLLSRWFSQSTHGVSVPVGTVRA